MIPKIQKIGIALIAFIFPLFFLPITQEFYNTNKFFLLAFFVIFMLVLSLAHIFVTKKITIQKSLIALWLFIFLIAALVSIIVSSPNKIEALLTSPSGFLPLLALVLFYLIVSYRNMSSVALECASYAAFIVGLLSSIFFFNPFKTIALPQYFQFLKNPSFTPIGSQIDLALFMGFFVVYELARLLPDILESLDETPAEKTPQEPIAHPVMSDSEKIQRLRNSKQLTAVILLICSVALVVSLSKIVPTRLENTTTTPILQQQVLLPPASYSWFAAVETLKKPATALFGVGMDNFASVWTRIKNADYNNGPYWQVNFIQPASFILQVWTEMGLFGLLTLLAVIGIAGYYIFLMYKRGANDHQYLLIVSIYLCIVLALLPFSLPLLFLFMLVLAAIEKKSHHAPKQIFDITKFIPAYIGIALIAIITLIGLGFFLTQIYASEYYFKRSLDAFPTNANAIYTNEQRAIAINPSNESFRWAFSQVNLLIANNIVMKRGKNLSEADRAAVAQALQQSISEVKNLVALNPEKASNWENLGIIYRNIINVAEGADVWTLSAYKRAIELDPFNPLLRLSLGGIYYSQNNFVESAKLFEQAVLLKPDWPNAYYNLAWSYFHDGSNEKAIAAMNEVIKRVYTNTPDYQKAQKELAQFKEKQNKKNTSPEEPLNETGGAAQSARELALPKPPVPVVTPRIELPNATEASPEATPNETTAGGGG